MRGMLRKGEDCQGRKLWAAAAVPLWHTGRFLGRQDSEFITQPVRPQSGGSAFFATELASWLSYRGVDTLLVAGCTTSGCIRASVVDGVSHNFRTVVLTDCVGDRAIGPHEANLFDMGQKYADLKSSAEVMSHYGRADAA